MGIVGIDLGTTNSLLSVWKDGEVVVVPNCLGEKATPSVVGLDDDGSLLIGQAAKDRLITHPDFTVELFKRYMGSGKYLKLGINQLRPEELSSLILKALKHDAENYLGEEVSEAVVSVPAYFSDEQRKATIQAGKLAGLEIKRLINEPTAAALAYGFSPNSDDASFVVFDLGGGTFDVSVLEFYDGVMEVRATAGDNFLGGEDFTSALERECLKECKLSLSLLSSKQRNQLRQRIERAKIELTSVSSTKVTFSYLDNLVEWEISREKFEEICFELLQRIQRPIDQALRDARITPSSLDSVLFVGGASRMPSLRKLATKVFRLLPQINVNPVEAIAVGACHQALLIENNSVLKDIVFTDVCPHSLGIEVVSKVGGQFKSGCFYPILERNNVVPISRRHEFFPVNEHQTKVSINVYQGESRYVNDNVLLDQLELDVTSEVGGSESVTVQFTYDVNGILQIDVVASSNNNHCSHTVNTRGINLSESEFNQSLIRMEKLKILPREQLVNRSLIVRCDRLYEEATGEVRTEINVNLNYFIQILDTQNADEIAVARKELMAFVDGVEQGMYQ